MALHIVRPEISLITRNHFEQIGNVTSFLIENEGSSIVNIGFDDGVMREIKPLSKLNWTAGSDTVFAPRTLLKLDFENGEGRVYLMKNILTQEKTDSTEKLTNLMQKIFKLK